MIFFVMFLNVWLEVVLLFKIIGFFLLVDIVIFLLLGIIFNNFIERVFMILFMLSILLFLVIL